MPEPTTLASATVLTRMILPEMLAQTLSVFRCVGSHTFFRLNASEGYVVAGGAALVGSELIRRPTQDLDLFTAAPVMSVSAAAKFFARWAEELSPA
jgi:hypothetical protein